MNELKKEAKWYVLFVETGKELLVRDTIYRLYHREVKALVPLKKVSERKEGVYYEKTIPLFPSYIFLQLCSVVGVISLLRGLPRAYCLVKDFRFGIEEGESSYKSICNEEMSFLMNLLDENDTIDYSDLHISDGSIEVKSGPLKRFKDNIDKIDVRKCKARIRINVFYQEKSIYVPIRVVN